jgi:predicted ATP-grasp superfamily ATP-dependent carboligase
LSERKEAIVASEHELLIFGASVRAAAFSALRAGLRPWCADLFGDTDLRSACPFLCLPVGAYPKGFLEASQQGPPGPWLYTGGLENRPALIGRLARLRPLWGNGPAVLRRARSPRTFHALLSAAGLPCPAVRLGEPPRTGGWLLKPRAGAGGTGIRIWTGEETAPPTKRFYFQELVDGDPHAAVYVGDGHSAHLLGVTRQLTALNWLHARPFAYCGSIGPLSLSPALSRSLERLGTVLAGGTGLAGIFGVDFILRDESPWLVEVNPRYTASVEVLEHGLNCAILRYHQEVFDSAALPPADPVPALRSPGMIGKAILFAPREVVFPTSGPWQQAATDPWRLPAFADIPAAGARIKAGRPILTFFARAASVPACLDQLRQIALDLDRMMAKP